MDKKLRVGTVFILALIFVSCAKNNNSIHNIEQITELQKNHKWFAFTEDSFIQINLPQEAPLNLEKPWTETVRISSAASIPYGTQDVPFKGYAVVNHAGILAFNQDTVKLFRDDSIFTNDTADGLIFSAGTPVFYLYRSSFFNSKHQSQVVQVQKQRPFLVEFNPHSKLCYPLVSYENIGLSSSDQITGYFWNGTTWACSAKKETEEKVDFTYFIWQPLMPLTDLSPALGGSFFTFQTSTEEEYKKLNMPELFSEAPQTLKTLLSSIPKQFSFYISWRDQSGTSAKNYFQEGTNSVPLNAKAQLVPLSECAAAVFADGTTYIMDLNTGSIKAFRLPKLPNGYLYGDFVIAGTTLYTAWEESNFYKTGRTGFISVDLSAL